MFELWIQKMSLDDAGGETPAQTRERLRDRFAPGAVRRMTQLGMLAGGALHEIGAVAPVVVYASSYGESCALESYLDSFPTPSPTLFQTSIHPSGVQQALIGSQQPVRELYPLSGDKFLAGQALAAAALAEAAGVVICGGEERGTYLLDHGVASDRAFGFALLLDRERSEASLGSVVIAPGGEATGLGLAAFFDLLKNRAPFDDGVAPGWRAKLAWR